jgi:hypothetical protein
MIFNETWCTQPSLGKGEVVSSILAGSTMICPQNRDLPTVRARGHHTFR